MYIKVMKNIEKRHIYYAEFHILLYRPQKLLFSLFYSLFAKL